MLDYGLLPPEINSGLMYTGPGAGPMTVASAAWDALAEELYLTATAYASVIFDLTSSWLGPSSVSMAAAAEPYVSWINATAAQALETSIQAKAAVAAYEAAFAMTVPPPVIAANRALLLALIATNFFGQNTPAIMATEAQYAQMWAQDAAAMYGYAGASSAASTFTAFTAPLPTTSSSAASGLAGAATQALSTAAGSAAQTVSPLTSAASTPLSSVLSTPLSSVLSTPLSSVLSTPLSSTAMPSALQGLVSTVSVTSSSSSVSSLTTASSSSTAALTSATSLMSGTTSAASMSTSGLAMLGSAPSLMNSASSTSALGNGFQVFGSALGSGAVPGAGVVVSSPGMGGAAVTAGVGRAASLGVLSVPQGWTTAAPGFSQVSPALPAASGAGATPPAAPSGSTGPVGTPLANSAERASASRPLAARYYVRPAVVQRPVSAG